MKKIIFLLGLLCLVSIQLFAQAEAGMKNIEKMCGCFSVNFKYAETFSPDPNYKYHEREDMNAVELALPFEKTDKKIVIQHLLVINDTMIIKHWREEWAYESPILYEYTANRVWEKKQLAPAEVKNKWTQTVWEVSDEPRYQGVSAWMQNDGKAFWESTADAPLPRREYSVRSDYNIMKRRNRIIITADGYMHEQDNEKILRSDNGKDKLIAQEKGYNSYFLMDDAECKVAKEWWKKNEPFWSVVRTQWQQVINDHPTLTLKWKVDDKLMNEHFFDLWREWKGNKIKSSELNSRVQEVMSKFM